jgi:hypothetical protein
MNVIVVLTSVSLKADIETFYEKFGDVLALVMKKKISKGDITLIIEDLNAKIDSS